MVIAHFCFETCLSNHVIYQQSKVNNDFCAQLLLMLPFMDVSINRIRSCRLESNAGMVKLATHERGEALSVGVGLSLSIE